MYPKLATEISEAAKKHFVELDTETIYDIIKIFLDKGFKVKE